MDTQCDPRVQRLATPRECSIFERNARDRSRDDLAQQARERWVTLTADAHVEADEEDDPLRRELWEALSACEYVLGKAATGTRQIIRRRGLVRAAEQLACKGELSAGFEGLDEAGLLAYAWEHVVLRHPEAFSEAATQSARKRLDNYQQNAHVSEEG